MATDAGGGRLVVFVEAAGGVLLFGGHPTPVEYQGPAVDHQGVEPRGPLRHRSTADEGEQEVVQLIGIPWAGPDLLQHEGDRVRIQRMQLIGRHREPIGSERPHAATQGERSRAALFERSTVEEGERTAAQDAVERGALGKVLVVPAAPAS